MREYTKQANDFCENYGITIDWSFRGHMKHFTGEKETRDVWNFTINRGGKHYSGRFGQSIKNKGVHPTAYDLLACLTKSDPGDFDDFCFEYGYEQYCEKCEGRNKKSWDIYGNVMDEWMEVSCLFDDVLEELREIQ